MVLKSRNIDSLPLEPHTLRLQKKSLFKAELSGERNTAPRTYYPVPRQAGDLFQDLCNVPGATGISSSPCNGTVGADPSTGNPPNGPDYGVGHGCSRGGFRCHRSR